MERADLNIEEIVSVVKFHKSIFFLIFSGVVIASVVASFIIPSIYKASAKIIIQSEQNLHSPGLLPNTFEERVFLNMQKEIILSSIILQNALDEVQKSEGILKGFDYDKIKKKVNIDYLNESNVLEVSVYLNSAKDAADLANSIAKTFLDYQSNAKIELIDKIFLAAKKETNALKESIDKIESQLKELSDKEKLSFYQAQIPFFMNNIQEVERRNMSVDSGIERIKEELKLANKENISGSNYPIMSSITVTPYALPESNTQLPTSYLANIPWLQEMKQKVADSQTELSNLLSVYTEEHPQIRDVRSKISLLQGSLNDEIKKVLSNYNEYYLNYVKYLEQQKKDNLSEDKRYKSELDKLATKMNEASAKQIEFYALLKYYESMQEIYSIFLRKQNELKFLREEARSAGVPNIRILEYAKIPLKPVSPNFALNLLLGIIIGFMAGVIGALMKDRA